MPKLAAAAPREAMGGGAGPTLLQPEFPAAGVESRGPLPHPLLRQYDVRPRSGPAGPGEPRRQRAPDRSRWGWLYKLRSWPSYVRRVTKHLRDGKEIGVVTDLLDEVKYPAEAMLTTYQSRWGIETVFHQITDVFSCGTWSARCRRRYCFRCRCLLMYNAAVERRPGVVPGM